MEYYRYILYVIFGVLPSLAWLSYYLRKDLHPEPRRAIIKIFIYGAVVTVPVFFVQIGLSELFIQWRSLTPFAISPLLSNIFKWFFIIALTEELFKYAVVKLAVLPSPELDEPLDIMLYMVVAALGFAALENILYLFSPVSGMPLGTIVKTTIAISFIRFIGATFLHTLCSGLVGYFMALSSMRTRHILTPIGIIIAALLHGLYNFSIINLSSPLNFLVPLTVVIGLTLFMLYDFNEIKKVKSICRLN